MKATRCEQRRCCELIWRNPSAPSWPSWAAPPLYCESRVHWWTAPRDRGLGRESGCYHGAERGGACSCLHRHPPAPLFHLEAEATDRNHSPPLQYWGSLHPRTLASLSFHFKGFLGTTYCQRVDCFKKELVFPPHILLEKVWVHSACPNLIQERTKAHHQACRQGGQKGWITRIKLPTTPRISSKICLWVWVVTIWDKPSSSTKTCVHILPGWGQSSLSSEGNWVEKNVGQKMLEGLLGGHWCLLGAQQDRIGLWSGPPVYNTCTISCTGRWGATLCLE